MATLVPGTVSPTLPVPAGIKRPEYVGRKGPRPYTGGEVQDAETVEKMRIASRIAADALVETGRAAKPGVTTDELDRIGHEYLLDHRAYPSTLGYKGYPKSMCTSVNEVICHGIPDTTVLEDGDIVNVDITAYIGGVHGDTNATFRGRHVDEESHLLVERTREALDRAIKAVRPGRQINVIGRVIESYAKRFGYGVVRDFTGHGISTAFHTGLIIPHYDDPSATLVMQPGMTFTIEPMLTLGTADYEMWADKWTARDPGPQAHRPVRAHDGGDERRRRGADAAQRGVRGRTDPRPSARRRPGAPASAGRLAGGLRRDRLDDSTPPPAALSESCEAPRPAPPSGRAPAGSPRSSRARRACAPAVARISSGGQARAWPWSFGRGRWRPGAARRPA